MKMTEEDLKMKIAEKKERLVRQQMRKEDLERGIRNNRNDISQLEYTLHKMKYARKKNKPRNLIPHEDIPEFFTRISRLYDYLQHRFHYSFNYTLFCLIVNSRYSFESRSKTAGHRRLSPATVLAYFKRERAEI